MAEKIAGILSNIAGIRKNLQRGTFMIKEGHSVAGINPEGVELELPLTPGMIEQRQRKLEEQEKALKEHQVYYSRKSSFGQS